MLISGKATRVKHSPTNKFKEVIKKEEGEGRHIIRFETILSSTQFTRHGF